MYATPFIVNEQGKTELLEKVPSSSRFSENWLLYLHVENTLSLILRRIEVQLVLLHWPICCIMNKFKFQEGL